MQTNLSPEDIQFVNIQPYEVCNFDKYHFDLKGYWCRFISLNKGFHNEFNRFSLLVSTDYFNVKIYFRDGRFKDSQTNDYINYNHKNLNKILLSLYKNDSCNKLLDFGIRYVKTQGKYYVSIKEVGSKYNLIPPEDISKVIITKGKYLTT